MLLGISNVVKSSLNFSAIELGLVKEILLSVIELGIPELEFAGNKMSSNCQIFESNITKFI